MELSLQQKEMNAHILLIMELSLQQKEMNSHISPSRELFNFRNAQIIRTVLEGQSPNVFDWVGKYWANTYDPKSPSAKEPC